MRDSCLVYAHLVEAETFGVGKTSYAADCALALTSQGFQVGGLLCLAVYRHHAGVFRWIGHDALLFPEGVRLPFARIDRPGWEKRNLFEGHSTRDPKLPPDRARQHPRLTADRRHLAVNLAAADRCLRHLQQVVRDEEVDAVVLDEVGTLLAGESARKSDRRLLEVCEALAGASKQVVVATVQVRGQHRQHIKACVDALKEMRHHAAFDSLVLNGLEPPELPEALLELRPA